MQISVKQPKDWGQYFNPTCDQIAAAAASTCSMATPKDPSDCSRNCFLFNVKENTMATQKNAAVAAIQFALATDDGLGFLRCWNQGDFDVIRREWPEAPVSVFVGVDPLHPATAA